MYCVRQWLTNGSDDGATLKYGAALQSVIPPLRARSDPAKFCPAPFAAIAPLDVRTMIESYCLRPSSVAGAAAVVVFGLLLQDSERRLRL
jgi:hypothetical protein